MTLTLAIPARDDAAGLVRLLADAAALGPAVRAVVVDDGSADPLDPARLAAEAGFAPGRLRLLRNPAPQGPGPARNRALAHVETDLALCMDADDRLTGELAHLLADLAGERFDFCLFQHHDSRAAQERRWGQMPWDQAHWRAAGVAAGALSEVSPAAAAELAQTANYPWNKLYRTEFLRAAGIGCSDIPLHEDVEMHWQSFLRADRILASDRICAIHIVAAAGGRQTNRRAPERLEVFGPLGRLAAEATAQDRRPLALPLLRFGLGLGGWIEGNLPAESRPRLRAAAAEFARAFPPELLETLRAADPARLARVGL